MKKKVMVAMSGGVDSSVAAFLLKEEGCEVIGATMCLGSEGALRARCCGIDGVDDARRVCDRIGMPHYVFDFAQLLEDRVIEKFIAEYRKGRTPNPCVDCNRYLKFGPLLDKAEALGFDYLATGHYAMIVREDDVFYLKRPRDKFKDQTYFLYATPRGALGKILFPLADMRKEDVRRLAKKTGLPVAEKPESQDICFVDRRNLPAFVERRAGGAAPGPILDRSGKRIGTHRGIPFYTIGQRSGLGIAHPRPLYVLSINAKGNYLVAGEKEELRAKGLLAGDLNMLSGSWPREVSAKIRYRRSAARCEINVGDGKARVLFHSHEEAITPGQAVVFYDGDYVLGGGTIEGAIYENC